MKGATIKRIKKLLENRQLDDKVKKDLEEILAMEDLDENMRIIFEGLLEKTVVRERRFKKLLARSDKEDTKIRTLHQILNSYNEQLETDVQKEILKRKEKEEILFQQSKLAAMGEMIDAVAHQWKQPINIISTNASMLEFSLRKGKVDEDYIRKYKQKTLLQIKHMENTLDEFRTFFRPNRYENEFSVRETIDKVLILMEDELIKYKVEIFINCIEDFKLMGRENEFKHLIINLINNAKDAFHIRNIKKREIVIDILKNTHCKTIEITDNAGGISTDIIDDIFTVNVSTKKEGSGIGLYMSYQIAKKHNGVLNVENVKDGAKFIFCVKLGDKEVNNG